MKLLGFTSIQSDYDLLSSLYLRAASDDETEIKLIVSGAHLSFTYGNTIEQIEHDGIEVLQLIETLFGYDSKVSRIKSAALLMLSCLEQVAHYHPDFIVFAGDREDALVAAMVGAYLDIPTVHFYGGDHVQDGYVDNPVRHAVSKLATLHFVSCQQHLDRLLSIGEEADRAYNVGSIALDRFMNHKPMSDQKFNAFFPDLSGAYKFALMIYHPIDGELCQPYEVIANVATELNRCGMMLVILAPNSDPGNYGILDAIRRVSNEFDAVSYSRVERSYFLELYRRAELLVGNSSSGIIEAATLKKPVVNIGLRQYGRMAAENVIFAGCSQQQIEKAFRKLDSDAFKEALLNVQNPYGDGSSSEKAFQLLKKLSSQGERMLRKVKDPLH